MNTHTIDNQQKMKRRYSVQGAAKLGALLCCTALLITSCGVTSPDETVWEDVRNFSWPTALGTAMKYRTVSSEGLVVTVEGTVNIGIIDQSRPELQNMYSLYDLTDSVTVSSQFLHFLPSKDTLFVEQGGDLAADIALLAPLVKGHEWYSRDSVWHAEIIERYAFRKVQGKTYQNVIAVKYRKYPNGLSEPPTDTEWIRFFAEGVGEIMTVENTYPSSNAPSEVLPQQASKRELVEITPAAN